MKTKSLKTKIAFVYDWTNKIGGAERILSTLLEIWPEAPLYTSVYSPAKAEWANNFKVNPSLLNRLPFVRNHHELYPYLLPLSFENFNFQNYDLVISVTSSFAKGVLTLPKTYSLCYCLTPTRFLWSAYEEYFISSLKRYISYPVVSYLRHWDSVAASRPDEYLAISKNVQERIKNYYDRDSTILYPPVDTSWFTPKRGAPLDYYLVVSRLVPYKRIDLVVETFNKNGLPLKIIGTGSQMKRLRKESKNNIEFLGQLTDKALLGYYQNCRALIFPQEEDFGLTPIEAQSCGRPVIAYRRGGALETVIEGKTGVFFENQTSESLQRTIKEFDKLKIKREDCRENAKRFSKDIFKQKIIRIVEQKYK